MPRCSPASSAPLHAFALPRTRARSGRRGGADDADAGERPAARTGCTFVLVAAAFAAYAFVPVRPVGASLAIFGRAGIDAGTVVWIGALFGPAQVGARLIEFAFGRNVHPLWVARVRARQRCSRPSRCWRCSAFRPPTAAAFALMFGGANGLVTITRGAVPLALFGASGYGRLIGRLAGPFLLMQSAAPLVMAFVVERASDPAALALAAGFAAVALVCFIADQAAAANRTSGRCRAGWHGRLRRRGAGR